MKNVKRIVSVLMALCLLVCLSGCIKMDVGVEVKEEGKATMTAKMSMSEELYEWLASMEGSEPEEDVEPGENAEEAEDDVDLKEFVKGEDGYYSYSKTKEYESYDALVVDLQKLEASDGMPVFESVKIYKTGKNNYVFEAKTAVLNTDSMESGGMEVPDDWFSLTMSVKMPGDVTEVVGGKEQEDGTILYELKDFTSEKTFSVKSATPLMNTTAMIVVWVVGLSVIAVVTVLHFKRKNQLAQEKAEAEKAASEDENVAEEE